MAKTEHASTRCKVEPMVLAAGDLEHIYRFVTRIWILLVFC